MDIDLNIKKGEFVGIMGPSGAVETTLLNIISTIDKPSSGTVTIDGEDIVKMNEEKLCVFRRKKVGFIFQDFNLLDTLNVKEKYSSPLVLAKANPKEIEKRLREISEALGIEEIQNKYPYKISGRSKTKNRSC